MSKNNKMRNKRLWSKISRQLSKKDHWGERTDRPKFPHMQPKPAWVRSKNSHGWWSGKKNEGKTSLEKEG